MPASPDFGVGFEPMVFGTPSALVDGPSEAQGRVIDGVPGVAMSRAVLSGVISPSAQPLRTLLVGPMTSRDLKRHLRARLAVVKAEIRARKKLEAERDELLRLLAAAGNKTPKPSRADVRPIRNVAG